MDDYQNMEVQNMESPYSALDIRALFGIEHLTGFTWRTKHIYIDAYISKTPATSTDLIPCKCLTWCFWAWTLRPTRPQPRRSRTSAESTK